MHKTGRLHFKARRYVYLLEEPTGGKAKGFCCGLFEEWCSLFCFSKQNNHIQIGLPLLGMDDHFTFLANYTNFKSIGYLHLV